MALADRRVLGAAGSELMEERRGGGTILLLPLSVVLLAFFLFPVFTMIVYSFQSFDPAGAKGFTVDNYARLVKDVYVFRVVIQTVVVSVAVTFLTILLGYPYTLFLSRGAGSAKSVFLFILIAPLLVGIVVRSFGWLVILGSNGLIASVLRSLGVSPPHLLFNRTGVTIGLTHVLLPFMVLSLASVLEGLDPQLEEAAAVLGANSWRVFRDVTWPLSLNGVLTGSILVFVLSIGSFVTVMLLGGGERTMVLSLLLYQQISTQGNWNAASAIGMVLMTIAVLAVYAQMKLVQPRRAR